MSKKILILFLSFVTMLSSCAFASVYIEDVNEYIVNAPEIIEDGGSITIDSKENFVLSMDLYLGNREKVYISDGKNTKELIQDLTAARGVCIRNASGSAVWLYDENGKRIETGSGKKNFKIYFNFASQTAEFEVGGIKVYPSSNENSYAALSEITIGVSSCKTISVAGGKIGNVKAYFQKNEVEAEVEDAEFELWKSALKKLDIYPSSLSASKPGDIVTRGQFASIIAGMLKLSAYEGESAFTDVKAANTLFSPINALNRDGYMIGCGTKFKPNESINASQAMTVVARVLSYNKMYPNKAESLTTYKRNDNFRKTALDGINFKGDTQLLNLKDAVHLVYNTLTAIRFNDSYEYNNNRLYKDGVDETILAESFGLQKYEGTITTVDRSLKKATVIFKDGTSKTLDMGEGISLLNIEGTKNTIWLDRFDESIAFLMPYNNSRTLYGFVSEYNTDKDSGAVSVSKISNLKLSGYTDMIKTDGGYKVTDGTNTLGGSVDIVGKFVRLDVEDNKVTAINIIGDSVDGGLVSTATEEKITYTVGGVLTTLNFQNADTVVTVLNSTEVSYDKIGNSMYFDYVVSGDRMYLLVSDSVVKGEFKTYGTDYITIGESSVSLTGKTVYSSFDSGSTYTAVNSMSDFIGKEVTVYADMANTVRYIYTGGTTQLYGIVYGGKTKLEKTMDVAIVTDTGIEEKTYVYKPRSKTFYYPEVSYDDAIATSMATDGSCIYKFTISNDEIKKIEAVEWKSSMRTDGTNVDGTNKSISATANPKYVYVNPQATVIALVDKNGDFNPKKLDFSQIGSYKTNGYSNFSFRVDSEEPLASLLVFGDGYSNMYNSTWYYGIISNITEVYQNGEICLKYAICAPNGIQSYVIPKDNPLKVNGNPIEVGDVILYAYNGIENNIMTPLNDKKISLFDDTFTKYSYGQTETTDTGTVTYTRDFYVGGVFQNEQSGFIKLDNNGETVWVKKAGTCAYYCVDSDKNIREADISDLVGKKVYVSTYEGLAYTIVGKE